MIACLEEIAYQQGWVDASGVRAAAAEFKGTAYGRYLERLSEHPPTPV
jgi:glucose-1-phosphate thymidylyltransferase